MGEFNKTIYKKDSKGKIRMLNISTDNGKLIQESGLLDGKTVVHESMCKPKNVGKVNETTPEQQAISEAESKIKKKLDEGYFYTIEEAKNEVVILPMLAKDYKKEKKKVTFPCLVQPKLDGMRCLAILKNGSVKLISRKGKEITTLPHIVKELKVIAEKLQNVQSGVEGYEYTGPGRVLVLDGEVYAHGESFQRNMELIKKYRKGETEAVKYHVYDVVDELSYFQQREREITILIGQNQHEHLEQVPSQQIDNEAELKAVQTEYLNDGFEGTMVRWGNAGYKINGRSSNLLKYKDFIDITRPIKDVIPNDRNPEHGTPIFDWPGAIDGILKAGTKMSHAEREDLLKNKEDYIGQTAEIRFFEYSDTGVPRFPVMVGYRLDK